MNDSVGGARTSVLPVQFLDRSFRGAELQPEKRLQFAVLADAAMMYARYATSTTDKDRAVLAELDEWLASDTAAGPFSFVGICDSLGFDAAYVRRGVRAPDPRGGGRTRRRALRRVTGSRIRIVGRRVRRVA